MPPEFWLDVGFSQEAVKRVHAHWMVRAPASRAANLCPRSGFLFYPAIPSCLDYPGSGELDEQALLPRAFAARLRLLALSSLSAEDRASLFRSRCDVEAGRSLSTAIYHPTLRARRLGALQHSVATRACGL